MPRLELYDTVVLKDNRNLYGIVDRVHLDGEDALDDCLIIAHVPVDSEALAAFIKTGTPPRDYVFVMLAEATLGHVLVREDQVELIDRTFAFGDYVKQEGSSMLGSIVDFSEAFVLQPLWKIRAESEDDGWPVVATNDITRTPLHVCSNSCNVPSLPIDPDASAADLIFGVPGQELRKANDTSEGNVLIKKGFVGVVDDLVQNVTLIMDDGSIVIVSDADELYIPIPDFGDKPLVSLPEFDPDVRRPDIVVAQHGWSATIPLPHDEHHSGQLVVTNGRNLRSGRWLRGKYNKDLPHQGRIIDVRSRDVNTRWVAVNPFLPTNQCDYPRPPESDLELYENIDDFPLRSELRRDKSVMMFDPSRMPRELEDRRRHEQVSSDQFIRPHIVTPADIQVGNRVKFRDQAGAAVKYHGVKSDDGIKHGVFERISPSIAYGFDVNALKVVCTQQCVTVRWQDGTVSKHKSISLQKYDLFESDFMPSDMIVAREGMMQRPRDLSSNSSDSPLVPYNEMTIFEKPHEIHPSKVGILQSVDPVERIAQVKWYQNPSVCILGLDHSVLDRYSRFGQLNDSVEDVSLYEIMTFPALARRLKDLTIIPPKRISRQVAENLRNVSSQLTGPGMANVLMVPPKLRLPLARYVAAGVMDIETADPSSMQQVSPPAAQDPDWCGEIIALGTDGCVTVRVNVGQYSKDVLVERDQFVVHLDEGLLGWGDDSSSQDSGHGQLSPSGDMWDDYSEDEVMTISESVEYEGGHRLDDDSDDDNWADEEEGGDADVDMPDVGMEDHLISPEVLHRTSSPILTTSDRSKTMPQTNKASEMVQEQSSHQGDEEAIARLCSRLGPEKPRQFDILDGSPPPDQFQQSPDVPGDSPAFMKRILKEHKILATSLPEGEIYVRTYESRLDLMRCLIIGPPDTPFEHAPFVFDLQFTSRFPSKPPIAHFHSWTHGLGRINPNLYEEGKICLSLLGTWQGKGESESWSEKATVLQILVSLQGLVFVARPFYNEAGYEEAAEDDAYRVESLRYNEKTFVMARAFVKHALRNTIPGLENILAWIYLAPKTDHTPTLLQKVIDRAQLLIDESEAHSTGRNNDNANDRTGDLVDGAGASRGDPTKAFMNLLSRGAVVMLKKTIQNLREVVELVSTAGPHVESMEQSRR